MLVNGASIEHISVRDRGLLYGDGVFETILCEKGKPLLFNYHMQRFSLGCERLNLVAQNTSTIADEIRMLADGEDCIIKLMLTRGVRDRGYAYDACDLTYSRILDKSPVPEIEHDYYRSGVRLTLCQHQLPSNKKLAGIKHLNRLDQVIGRSECPAGYQEGVMQDQHGYIIEGTMSNIFMLANNVWYTPGLDQCGVNGVMREFLLTNVNEIPFIAQIKPVTLADLQSAEAVFICNSIIGIWPVIAFDEHSYPLHAEVKKIQKYLYENISNLYLM
jgi:4-amino-4-deoxychorismate lyase